MESGCYLCKDEKGIKGEVKYFSTVFGIGMYAHQECWEEEMKYLSAASKSHREGNSNA